MTPERDSLASVARDVANALVSSEARGASAFVNTPIAFPSGANVVVRLEGCGGLWFVSDDGYGQLEAEMMGALVPFRTAARSASERSGVAFDGRCFFLTDVERDALPGAVATIANASQRAVTRAAFAVEERRIAVSRSIFEQRLDQAFGAKSIRRQAPIVGQSGKEWEIDAAIERGGVVVRLFEFVTPRAASVATAVMKFSDIRALEEAPSSAAVLSDYDRTDPHLISLLSRVAGSAFSASADREAYREVA